MSWRHGPGVGETRSVRTGDGATRNQARVPSWARRRDRDARPMRTAGGGADRDDAPGGGAAADRGRRELPGAGQRPARRDAVCFGDGLEVPAPDRAPAAEQPVYVYVRPHEVDVVRHGRGRRVILARVRRLRVPGPEVRVEGCSPARPRRSTYR